MNCLAVRVGDPFEQLRVGGARVGPPAARFARRAQCSRRVPRCGAQGALRALHGEARGARRDGRAAFG